MTIFVRTRGLCLFSQNEDICTRCYYHPIFGSKIALSAIMNELDEIAVDAPELTNE